MILIQVALIVAQGSSRKVTEISLNSFKLYFFNLDKNYLFTYNMFNNYVEVTHIAKCARI
jgi:hypothetical protein